MFRAIPHFCFIATLINVLFAVGYYVFGDTTIAIIWGVGSVAWLINTILWSKSVRKQDAEDDKNLVLKGTTK